YESDEVELDLKSRSVRHNEEQDENTDSEDQSANEEEESTSKEKASVKLDQGKNDQIPPGFDQWLQRFAELKAHKEKHGHFHIPNRDPLYRWKNKQQVAFREGRLSPLKIAKLNEIEFIWSTRMFLSFTLVS